jgi:hypothetical protein
MDTKHIISALSKEFAKKYPVTWNRVTKKRYLLPKDREADYYGQEKMSVLFLANFIGRYTYEYHPADPANNAGWGLSCLALQCDRPTLYLEWELGEKLVRTEIPADFSSDDIHWRWPAVRIALPHGLITIEREGKLRNVMYVDIGHTKELEELWPPQECTNEMLRVFNRSASIRFGEKPNSAITATRFCLLICAALDYSDLALPERLAATVYGGCQIIEHLDLEKISCLWNTEETFLPLDQQDDHLKLQVDRLVINLLLYLSQMPLEYQTTAIRKPRMDGKRLVAGLYPARFVGDLQLRSKTEPRKANEPSGGQLPGHWRSGHWKRQVHGPGRALRKLIWLQPYKTLGQ